MNVNLDRNLIGHRCQ